MDMYGGKRDQDLAHATIHGWSGAPFKINFEYIAVVLWSLMEIRASFWQMKHTLNAVYMCIEYSIYVY